MIDEDPTEKRLLRRPRWLKCENCIKMDTKSMDVEIQFRVVAENSGK